MPVLSVTLVAREVEDSVADGAVEGRGGGGITSTSGIDCCVGSCGLVCCEGVAGSGGPIEGEESGVEGEPEPAGGGEEGTILMEGTASSGS